MPKSQYGDDSRPNSRPSGATGLLARGHRFSDIVSSSARRDRASRVSTGNRMPGQGSDIDIQLSPLGLSARCHSSGCEGRLLTPT